VASGAPGRDDRDGEHQESRSHGAEAYSTIEAQESTSVEVRTPFAML
jgi:hypothetical protein